MSNSRCMLVEYDIFLRMFEKNGWDRTGKFRNLWTKIYNELCEEYNMARGDDPECTCSECPDE